MGKSKDAKARAAVKALENRAAIQRASAAKQKAKQQKAAEHQAAQQKAAAEKQKRKEEKAAQHQARQQKAMAEKQERKQQKAAQYQAAQQKRKATSTSSGAANQTNSKKRKADDGPGTTQGSAASKKFKTDHISCSTNSRKIAPLSKKRNADQTQEAITTTSSTSKTVGSVEAHGKKRKANDEADSHDENSSSKKLKAASGASIQAAQVHASPESALPPKRSQDMDREKISFHDLPAEIRNEIYHLAFNEKRHINIGYSKENNNGWSNEHPLLSTCHQIRGEAMAMFHRVTQFQTNKVGVAAKFIKNRVQNHMSDLGNVRISVTNKPRSDEHTLRRVRRTLHAFKHAFRRRGLKDGVVQMELPVFNSHTNEIKSIWISEPQTRDFKSTDAYVFGNGRTRRITRNVRKPPT